MSGAFTDRLRAAVTEHMGMCPHCGRAGEMEMRRTAKAIGVAHSTLWRFLSQKHAPSAAAIDAMVAWLERGGVPVETLAPTATEGDF